MTSEIEFYKPSLFSAILPTIVFATISFHSVPLLRVVVYKLRDRFQIFRTVLLPV